MKRTAVAIALSILVLVLGASPAAAHTRLIASDPVADALMDIAPSTVRLTFSEAISTSFATISVVGPDGAQYAQPNTTTDGADAIVSTTDAMPAGAYTIGYRVTSADGHPITGTTMFTLTAAAVPAAAPLPSDLDVTNRAETPQPQAVEASDVGSDDGGNSVVVWSLVAALVTLAGVGAAFVVRGARS